MSDNLFSQIPAQVLYKIHHKSDITPPRREKVVKFYHDNKVRSDQSTTITEESSSTDGEEVVIAKFTHQDDNEPSSSFSESPKWAKEPSSPATPSLPVKPATKRKVSDAIVQTNSDVQYRAASTQTDESLENRPLSMTIDKMQPLDIQSFAPIRAIPKNRSGYIPPLRIGLTLKGKKRKVYYPDDDEDSNANAA